METNRFAPIALLWLRPREAYRAAFKNWGGRFIFLLYSIGALFALLPSAFDIYEYINAGPNLLLRLSLIAFGLYAFAIGIMYGMAVLADKLARAFGGAGSLRGTQIAFLLGGYLPLIPFSLVEIGFFSSYSSAYETWPAQPLAAYTVLALACYSYFFSLSVRALSEAHSISNWKSAGVHILSSLLFLVALAIIAILLAIGIAFTLIPLG